jgi:RNA polymerase sigma-70 factor (ECF subfamily)
MSRVEAIGGAMAEADGQESKATSISASHLVLLHYDQEHIALRRYLLLTGIDDQTAQEIVQETFLKLHSHLNRNGERTNLRAWLYRVARNLALNEHSSARRRGLQQIDETEGEEAFGRDEDSPETLLLQNEREAQVRRAMQKLSLPQRECLLLRTEGMKYREIAEVLQISVASVGENIQRGLERLKRLL